MLKQIFDSCRKAVDFARKTQQYGEDIRKLQETESKHQEKIDFNTNALQRVLHEFDKDRIVSSRDREILILKLEAALRENTPLRLSGDTAPPQSKLSELEAEIAALRNGLEELARRVAALERP